MRNFRIVQTEGSRQVTRNTNHYNLQMIIAVGFKVNNERADADKPHMGLTTWAAAPEG
ncbi:MAG: RhuM family protein [Acetatifactor sp.]